MTTGFKHESVPIASHVKMLNFICIEKHVYSLSFPILQLYDVLKFIFLDTEQKPQEWRCHIRPGARSSRKLWEVSCETSVQEVQLQKYLAYTVLSNVSFLAVHVPLDARSAVLHSFLHFIFQSIFQCDVCSLHVIFDSSSAVLVFAVSCCHPGRVVWDPAATSASSSPLCEELAYAW